jgi:transketolase
MISKTAKLVENIFDKDVEQEATRQGYGEGLVLAGEEDPRVVVLCADLTDSTRSSLFAERFPERFVEIGVAETRKTTLALAKAGKPAYLRFTREKTPVFTTLASPFELGRANVLWQSKDPKVALIACGPLVYEALLAANELDKLGVGSVVVNCHTLDPIDEETIIRVAKKCGAVVSIEEHQVSGGLGGAIAETLVRNHPTPQEFIGMPNSFGESGEPQELLRKYGMQARDIVAAAKKVIERV